MSSSRRIRLYLNALPLNSTEPWDEDRLVLTASNFREACDGLDTRMVAQALKDAGILHTNDGQFKAKYSNAWLGISKVRHFILVLDRLGAGTDPDDDTEKDPEAWVDEALDDALEETHGPEEWGTGPHRFGSLDGF